MNTPSTPKPDNSDVEDQDLMRLFATRNHHRAKVNKINPALVSADVIARRDCAA